MSKIGRNELCTCGSGKKFKKCCESKTASRTQSRVLMLTVGAAITAAIVAGVASFRAESSSVRVWDPAHGHYHDANGVQVP